MSDRFECSLDPYLAGLFVEKLSQVLEKSGYKEVLRLAEPHIIEFRSETAVLTLQIGYPHGHKQSVIVESESVDVNLLVTTAVRDTIIEVSDKLLGCLHWLDHATVHIEIAAHLSSLVAPSR